MKKSVCTFEATTPYSQSKPICEEEFPKKDDGKEKADAWDKRVCREHLHYNQDGRVFIPGAQFKNAITDAASYLGIKIKGRGASTYAKHLRSGVCVVDDLYPEVLIGGKWVPNATKDMIPTEAVYVDAMPGKAGGGRVWRNYPVFQSWRGQIAFIIVDGEITEGVWKEHLEAAGLLIGIGRWRAERGGNYGRFVLRSHTWTEYKG